MEKPIRCALYVRVSTKQQVDKDYNSIESQKDRLLEYVNRKENYHVYKIYEDPAYSAKDSERPALQQMFDDVKKGKLDCVLVYKMDRLSRSNLGFHKMVDTLEKHGVNLVSITENFDSSTVHGRFSRNIMMNFAQMEREMVSERTKDKLLERAKKGLWNGGRPYGYDCKDKRLIINEEQANVIRFMFDFFIHDASLARLRDELKARGIYTAKGYRWTASQISHKLRNPVYAGKIKHRDKVYPGIHETIISEELFAKVQKLVPERTWSKRKTERTYLLTGLLKCQDCGSTITTHYTSKKRKDGTSYRIPYYRCTKTVKYGNQHCNIKSFNADYIEKLVIEEIGKISQNTKLIDVTVDDINAALKQNILPTRNEIKELEKRIRQIDSEVDRLLELYAKGGKLVAEVLNQKVESKLNDKKKLESKLIQLNNEIDEQSLKAYDAEIIRSSLSNFTNIFATLSPDDKAKALRILLRDIDVYKDRIVLNVYELPEFSIGSINHDMMVGDTGLEPVTPCL